MTAPSETTPEGAIEGRGLRDHGLDGGRGPHNRGRVKGTARVEVCKACGKCQGCCCEGSSSWDTTAISPGMNQTISGVISCTPNTQVFNPPGDTFMVRFLGSDTPGGRDFGIHSETNQGSGIPLAPFLKKCTHWKLPAGGTLVDMSCYQLDFQNTVTTYQPPPYDSGRIACVRDLDPTVSEGKSPTGVGAGAWTQFHDSGMLFEDQTLCEKIHERVSGLGGYEEAGIPFAWGPGNSEGDRIADTTATDYHVPGNCEWTFASTGYPLLGLELAPGNCGGYGIEQMRGSGIIQGSDRPLGDNKIPLIIDPPDSHYAIALPGTGIKPGWQATGYVEIDSVGRLVIDSNGDPVGDFYGGSGYLKPLEFGTVTVASKTRYILGLSGTGAYGSVTLTGGGWYPNFHTICTGPDIGYGPGRWGNGHWTYPRVSGLGGRAPGFKPSHCSPGPHFYGTGHVSGSFHVVGAQDWIATDYTKNCCPNTSETGWCLGTPEFLPAEGNSFIAGFGNGTVIGYSNTDGQDKPGTRFPWRGYSDHTEGGQLRNLGASAVGGSEPTSHRLRYDLFPRDASGNPNIPVANNARKGLPTRAREVLASGSCGPEKMITVGGGGSEYPPSHVTPDGQGGRWCPDGNGQEWLYVTAKNPLNGGDCCPPFITGVGGTWNDNGSVTGGIYKCCGYTPSPSSTSASGQCEANSGVWYKQESFGKYAPRCCDDEDRYSNFTCEDKGWSGCQAMSVTDDSLGLMGSPPYYPHSGSLPPGGVRLSNCVDCENCFDGAGKTGCVAWTGSAGAPGMEEAMTGYWNEASWACGNGAGGNCPDGEYTESGPGSGDGRSNCCVGTGDNCTRHSGGNPGNCGMFNVACAPDEGVKIWGYAAALGGCTTNNFQDGEWHGVYPSAVPCPGGISDLKVRGIGTPRLILQCYHSHGGKSEAEIDKKLTTWPAAGMTDAAKLTYRRKLKDLSRKFPEWMQQSGTQHFIDHSGTSGATSGSLADGGKRTISYSGLNPSGVAYLEGEYIDGYWADAGRAGCRDMNPTGNESPRFWHPSGIVDGIHYDDYNNYLISGSTYKQSGHRAQYYPFKNTLEYLHGREPGDEASEGQGDFLNRSGQMLWPRTGEEILYWADDSSLGFGSYYDHFPYGSSGVYQHTDAGDPKTGCRVRAYLVYDFFENEQHDDKDNSIIPKEESGPAHGELEIAGHGATGNCTMKVGSIQLKTTTMDYAPKSLIEDYVAGGSGFFERPILNFVAQSGAGAYCSSDMPTGQITGRDAYGNVQNTSWTWGGGAYDSSYFNQANYQPQGDGASGHVEMKLFDLHLTASGSNYSHIPKIEIEPPSRAFSRRPSERECAVPTGALGAHAEFRTMSGTIVGFEVIDPGYGFYVGNEPGYLSSGGIPNLVDNAQSAIVSEYNPAWITTGTPVLGVISAIICSGGCGYTGDFDVEFSNPGSARGVARVECGSVDRIDITDHGGDGSIDNLPEIDFSAGAGSGASGIAIVGLIRIDMDQGLAPVGSYAYHDFSEENSEGCKMDALPSQGGVFVEGPARSTELNACCVGGSSPSLDDPVCQSLLGDLKDPVIKAIFGSGSITPEDASGLIVTNHGYGYTHVPKVTVVERNTCSKSTDDPVKMIAEMSISKVVVDNRGSGYILPPEGFFECEGKLEVDPSQTTSSASTAIGKCWPAGFSTGLFTFDRSLSGEYGATTCAEARFAKQHNSQCETFDGVTCCHPNGVYLNNVYLSIDKVNVTYGGDSYDEFGRSISYREPLLSRGQSGSILPYVRFYTNRALKCGAGNSCGAAGHPYNAGRLSSEPRPFYYDLDPGSKLDASCGAHAHITRVDSNGQIPLGTGAVVIDSPGDHYLAAPEIHFVGLNGWRSTKCTNQWFYDPPECNDVPVYGSRNQVLYPTGLEHTHMGTWQTVTGRHPSGSFAWPMGQDYYWAKYTIVSDSISKGGPATPGKLCSIGPDVDSRAEATTFPGETYVRKWMEINVPLPDSVTTKNTLGTKYGLSAVWVCDDFNCEADGDTRNTFYLASGFQGEGACCSLPYGVEVWNPNCACEIKGDGGSGHNLLSRTGSMQGVMSSSLKASPHSPPVLSNEDWDFLIESTNGNGSPPIKRVKYATRAQNRQSRPENPTPLTNNVGIVKIEKEEKKPSPQVGAPLVNAIVPKEQRGRTVDSKEEDVERMQKEAWEKNKDVRGGLVKQTKRYVNARQKWNQNGRPIRSQERVNEIFNICQTCPNFTGSACSLCGCRITMQGNFMNKLAWATESCPDNPPRWGADVDV